MELLGIIVIILIYFIPTWLASGKQQGTSVFLLNLLLGWTLIGWVIAFIWGAMKDSKPTIINHVHDNKQDYISDLEKISTLKKDGVLSEEEFQEQKKIILNKIK